MKILSAKITNFLTIGPTVHLNLNDRGLILITGENRDDSSATSNGSGKSTIGDAISWCNYGVTVRGESGDEIINNTVGKECSVYQEIDDEGESYSIARYRKHKTFKNSLQVHNLTTGACLTLGTDKLTQELVNKIIGCTYEVFKSAIYAGQDSIPNLPGMTDKNLKEIVEEAAGINRLSEAYLIAKDDLKRKELVLAKVINEATSANVKLATLEDSVVTLEKSAENYEKVKLENLNTQKKELVEAIDAMAVIEKSAHFNLSETTLNEEIALGKKNLSDLLSGKKELEQKERKLHDSLNNSKGKFAVKIAEIKRKVAEIGTIQDRVGQPCGECGKDYCEEDLDSALQIAKKDLNALKRGGIDLKETLRIDTETHGSALSDVLACGDTSAAVSDNQAVAAKILASLSGLRDAKAQHKALKVKMASLTASADKIRSEESPYADMIAKALKSAEATKVEIDNLKTECEVVEKERDLLIDAVKVFSPAGVRAHIIDTVTPFLNDRTSHYLSILSDGNMGAVWNTLSKTKSGDLREKFVIEVSNDKGAKLFGGLSGGEKRKVRISTTLALQDLVSSRAAKPFNLFIADEIDDALDSAGLERLMVILDEKSREKGTVLLISHNDIEDFVREQSTVIKEGGFSRVEGGLADV